MTKKTKTEGTLMMRNMNAIREILKRALKNTKTPAMKLPIPCVIALLPMLLFAACKGKKHEEKAAATAVDTSNIPVVNIQSDTINNIKPTERRLRYLFYANGGLVGYFNDGTVVGCPRCDLDAGNVERMLKMEPMGAYVVLKDGTLLVDGSRKEYPEVKNEWNEWMIFDSDAEWENFINDKDDISSTRNQQWLMQFLNGYIKICGQQTSLKERMNRVLASINVTDDFKSAYQKFYEENPDADFDPILNAQDCPEKMELNSFGLEDYYFTFRTGENDGDLLVTRIKRIGDKWLVDGCGVVNIPKEKIISN